jgi:hypothetical protein
MATLAVNKYELSKYLLKIGICLPGSLYSRRKWYKSIWTVLSPIGLLLTVANGLFGFLNHPPMPRRMSVLNSRLVGQTRPISGSATSVLSPKNDKPDSVPHLHCPTSNGEQPPLPPRLDNANETDHGKSPEEPSVVVDIVLSTYKLIGYLTNFGTRIIICATFPSIRTIIHDIEYGISERKRKWMKAGLKWTIHEKKWVGLMVISMLERLVLVK